MSVGELEEEKTGSFVVSREFPLINPKKVGKSKWQHTYAITKLYQETCLK